MKKKILSAVLMAAMVLSVAGCGGTADTPDTITADNKITTATVADTTIITVTEITTEDTSLITADTREELAIGLLEAICAGDKAMAQRYGVSNKNYTLMQETLVNGKETAGFTETDEVTAADFEIYFAGPFNGSICKTLDSEYDKAYTYVISEKYPTVSFHFQITYDYDLEQYVIDSAFVDGTEYNSLLPRLEDIQPI